MRAIICGFGLALCFCLAASTALSADDKKETPSDHPQDKPGPVHKRMAKLAGEYTTVSKFYMKPGETPQESTGTAKFTSVVDGMFVQEKNTGKIMDMPYSGARLWGYNNLTHQFEAVWVFSMSSAIMKLTGTTKDEGKTIQWTGTYDRAKGVKATLDIVTHLIDEDRLSIELSHKNPDGSKGPTMETTYTRKK